MKAKSLSSEHVKKLALTAVGFIALFYVYFSFLLGPLSKTRAGMIARMDDLQRKIGSSKSEMMKATNLEQQAGAATTRFAELKNLTTEGAPIAWFPPRMKTFFSSHGIDKVTARLDSSAPFTEPELASWTRYNWMLDIPQTDYAVLGSAVAALENTEPLLTIRKVSIKTSPEGPQFQQVMLSATAALVKK